MSQTVRITNLRQRVEEPESSLLKTAARKLKLKPDDVQRLRILRKSLDARKTDRLEFVYSIAVDLPESANAEKLLARSNIDSHTTKPFDDPQPGPAPMSDRPVVIGSGPACLLAGYFLA